MKVIFNLLKTKHIDTSISRNKFRFLNETDCALLENFTVS